MLLHPFLLSDLIHTCGFSDLFMLMTLFCISNQISQLLCTTAWWQTFLNFLSTNTPNSACPKLDSSVLLPFSPYLSVPAVLTNFSRSKKECIPCSLFILGLVILYLLFQTSVLHSRASFLFLPPVRTVSSGKPSLTTPNHRHSPPCLTLTCSPSCLAF